MPNEPTSLRAHLLTVEPPDPRRRERLQQEIQAMIENRLSARGRIGWIAGLGAAVLFATWGAVIAAMAPVDPSIRVIWCIYALANVASAVYSLRVLLAGRLDPRWFERAIGLIAAGALVIAIVLFWRAAVTPTLGNLLWALFGVLCVMIDFFWLLHYRIYRSEWAAKENHLRLELLLLDIRGRSDGG